MINIPLKLWLIAFLLSLGFSSHANSGAKPFFYQLQWQDHRAWLLGSIHVGHEGFYPLAETIESAFNISNILALEVDPADPDLAQMLAEQPMRNFQLSPELKQKLSGQCQLLGIVCDLSIAPWQLATQIGMAQMKRLGYRAELGVDLYFYRRYMARTQTRPIWQLEGMQSQLDTLNQLSPKAQIILLEAASENQNPQALIQAWYDGDAKALAEQVKLGLAENAELKAVMIDHRNQRMSKRITQWLQTETQLFIIVGAAHLIGEQGIPAQLDDLGITVIDCSVAPCARP